MHEAKRFFQLLKPIKRQLIFLHLLKEIQLLFLLISTVFFFWMIASRVILIGYFYNWVILSIFGVFAVFLYRFWKGRPATKESVNILNSFVPDDLVITAYSFIYKEGPVEQLVLRDANRLINKNLPQVLKRKKRIFYPYYLLTGTVFLSFALLSVYLPNSTFEANIQNEKERQFVEQFKKDLVKEIQEEENPDKKKALEELAKEIEETKTVEELGDQITKEMKELDLKQRKENEKHKKLEEFQNDLKESGLNELANAIENQDLEKINEELAELQKNFENLSKSQQDALTNILGSKEFTEEELAQLQEMLKEAIESGIVNESMLAGKQALQDQVGKFNEKINKNGLPQSLALAPSTTSNLGDNKSGQSESNSNNSGNDSTGEGSGEGKGQGSEESGSGSEGAGSNEGAGDSEGTGSGEGSGEGTGNGQGGSGSGSGSGTGTGGSGSGMGGGSGAGIGSGSRDFLTIPEFIDGEINIEYDFGPLGEGAPSEEYESDGPVLKGSLRPYEEVYSQYEEAFRKSMNRIQLPKELENIVKDYFSDVKP